MPRTARAVAAGVIYHVLNRGNGRMGIFHKAGDYLAFIKLLAQARQRAAPVDLLGFCLMPNHWHLVLRPAKAKDLAIFMRWLCTAHVRRHHAHYRHAAGGHLYQGRYKSFPVQDDLHFLTLMRYVESNALRARLVRPPAMWQYASQALRNSPDGRALLTSWPMAVPDGWDGLLKEKMPQAEQEQCRQSIACGRPFGSPAWVAQTARLGLNHTLRPPGRPKKKSE